MIKLNIFRGYVKMITILKKILIFLLFIETIILPFHKALALEEDEIQIASPPTTVRLDDQRQGAEEDVYPTSFDVPLSEKKEHEGCPLLKALLKKWEINLEKRRVLSLDGGGVRGSFTSQVLARMEEETGRATKDTFKGSITGTSTGSFIALGLVSPNKDGESNTGPYSASEIVDFYRTQGSQMFSGCCALTNCMQGLICPPSFSEKIGCVFKNIFSCFGCFGCCYNCYGTCGPMYSRKTLDTQLQSLLGPKRPLRDALGPVQTTTYDLSPGGGILRLSSTDPFTNEYSFEEAGAASSAAPTYFPAPIIGDGSKEKPRRICVDGGLIENNPMLAALLQAQEGLEGSSDIRDFTLVSIGTGQAAGSFSDENLRYAGALSWAKPIIEIGMSGTSMATDLSFKRIFKEGNYYRMQVSLPEEALEMDNPRNIQGLIKEADKFCADPHSSFRSFMNILKKEKEFKDNMIRLYGEMNNDEFMEVLESFRKVVGVTYEDTKLNIQTFLNETENSEKEKTLATQISQYFNDPRLLKALKIELIALSNKLAKSEPINTKDPTVVISDI